MGLREPDAAVEGLTRQGREAPPLGPRLCSACLRGRFPPTSRGRGWGRPGPSPFSGFQPWGPLEAGRQRLRVHCPAPPGGKEPRRPGARPPIPACPWPRLGRLVLGQRWGGLSPEWKRLVFLGGRV